MSLKNQHTTADFLSWEESRRIINRLYEDGYYQYCLLFVLGTRLGLRIGDIKRLTWDDVLSQNRLVFHQQKRNKKRNIEISRRLQDVVTDLYRKIQPKSEFMITMSIQAINQMLKKIKARYDVDIDNFSTHTFRKTFGRRVCEQDDYSERSLIYLMEMFNHSSIHQTKTYLGIRQEELDGVYSMLCEDL